jgi:hypothetical protein
MRHIDRLMLMQCGVPIDSSVLTAFLPLSSNMASSRTSESGLLRQTGRDVHKVDQLLGIVLDNEVYICTVCRNPGRGHDHVAFAAILHSMAMRVVAHVANR